MHVNVWWLKKCNEHVQAGGISVGQEIFVSYLSDWLVLKELKFQSWPYKMMKEKHLSEHHFYFKNTNKMCQTFASDHHNFSVQRICIPQLNTKIT